MPRKRIIRIWEKISVTKTGNRDSRRHVPSLQNATRPYGWIIYFRRFMIRTYRLFRNNFCLVVLLVTTFMTSMSVLRIIVTKMAIIIKGVIRLRLKDTQKFPRTFGCYFQTHGHKIKRTKRLPTYVEELYPSKRRMDWTPDDAKFMKNILNSRKYSKRKPSLTESINCTAQHDWQSSTFPSCNTVHEQNLYPFHSFLQNGRENDDRSKSSHLQLVASGFWRDVWMIHEFDNVGTIAMKTIRMEQDFDERNYDRHRRDALAMDRLTFSPYIANVFGYCGNSGLYEYSHDGSIEDLIWPQNGSFKLSMYERVKIAAQVAYGIADMHDADKNNIPSIVHTDITPSQFISIGGVYKLNDFNRCRFLSWNREERKPCSYRVVRNPGTFRSPEEYLYVDQSEKIDIYSMGNIFYSLLTENWPFENEEEVEARVRIKEGNRPAIDSMFLQSKDLSVSTLLKGIEMCWKQNPDERSSAEDLAHYFTSQIQKILQQT